MNSPAPTLLIGSLAFALCCNGCRHQTEPVGSARTPAHVAARPNASPLATTPARDAPVILSSAAQAIPSWARATVFHRVKTSTQDKCIALTFDDGPWPGSTKKILQVLEEHHAKATFFMIGGQIREYPAIARAVRDAGHAIGNHSWNHPSRPRDSKAQVEKTDRAIREVLQITPTLFRPPYGIETNGMAKWAKQAKEAVLIWSVDTADWRRPGASRIASRAVRGASPGAIILMHDGGGDRRQTVAALPEILDALEKKGYRFVTIPELLGRRKEEPPVKTATSAKPPHGAIATTKPLTVKGKSISAKP